MNAIKWDPQVKTNLVKSKWLTFNCLTVIFFKDLLDMIGFLVNSLYFQGKFLASCSDDMTLKVGLQLTNILLKANATDAATSESMFSSLDIIIVKTCRCGPWTKMAVSMISR